MDRAGDPEADLARALEAKEAASARVAQAREALAQAQARRSALQAERDQTGSSLAQARADLAGVEREYQALLRDREARAKAQKGASGRRLALDAVRAEAGYERALAAVLGLSLIHI